jgi:hypothetical protein
MSGQGLQSDGYPKMACFHNKVVSSVTTPRASVLMRDQEVCKQCVDVCARRCKGSCRLHSIQ